jgi:hypothetical protein
MDWKPILSCIGDWPCNFLVFNNFILSLLNFYPSQFQTIPHWITSIVLKPDPVIDPVGWSGQTRVNPKKNSAFSSHLSDMSPKQQGSYPLLSSMLDFCLASARGPENAGDVADMSQTERPCPKNTGGVEDWYPNRISRKWK